MALSRWENTQVSVETSGVSRWGRLLTGASDLAELQEGAGAGAARGDPRGGAAGPAPGGRLEAGVLSLILQVPQPHPEPQVVYASCPRPQAPTP